MLVVGANNWYDAYIAIGLISLLPNLLLVFIPAKWLTTKTHNGLNFQNMFLCFAAAGLLGDVFLHTLPHLLGSHTHDHGNSHNDIAHGASSQHEHTHREHMHHEHHGHSIHLHDSREHMDDTSGGAVSVTCSSFDSFDVYHYLGLERSIVIALALLLGFLVFFYY